MHEDDSAAATLCFLDADAPPRTAARELTLSQEDWESAAQAMQSAQRTRLEMRLDILDVLANALGRLDEINRVIRDSTDRNAARIALTTEPFGYSEISVDHLLDMTLARQTARARSDLENERAVIRAELDG